MRDVEKTDEMNRDGQETVRWIDRPGTGMWWRLRTWDRNWKEQVS